MIPQALIHYVETEIIPRYEHFDKAHNRSHVQTVIDESLALAKLYPQADERLVYTIAAYHDTGLCRDRATHHLVSGEIIAADSNLLQWFDKEEMAIMREAVEDHRASSSRQPRSIYGKIVAEADRDIDVHEIFLRAIEYGKENYPEKDKEEQWKRFSDHMDEKYSRNGYIKLWIPNSPNEKALKELRNIIDNKAELRKHFEEIYEELKKKGS